MKRFFCLVGIIALILLLAIIAFHGYRYETKKVFFAIFPIFASKPVDQPIVFNHLIHKEKVNLSCTFCHRYAGSYRSSGIPNIEICGMCHSTPAFSKRPEAIKVYEYVKATRQIPWVRMYELPGFVVFPHWIHIQSGVDCSICHGVTGLKERPVRMVDRNTMEWCIHCHQERGADTECYTCHSS